MANSELIKINKKIADNVTNGYKKIENAVVNSYKKTQNAVVGSYKKIEDAFVDRYLTRDGETVEEAKKRINSNIKN